MASTKGKYEDLVERHFQVVLRSGDEFMCRCLKHEDSSASLQFNVEKGLFYCFSCHWAGNVKTLTRELGESFRETVDVSDVLKRLDALDEQAKQVAFKPLPETVLRRYDFPTDYWAGRGFTDTTIDVFNLGYDPLENCATIPVRTMSGGLLGVIRRRLINDGGPRYLYPKGFPRKTSLFGSWLVAKSVSEHAVLVEGSVDAMSVWQSGHQGLAQYGSSLNPAQVRLLGQLGVQHVTLFFDNDKAGWAATDIAADLLRDFYVDVVRYRRSDPKDPGAASSRRVRQMIDSAVPLIFG